MNGPEGSAKSMPLNIPEFTGERYEEKVPDTLDLAERAEIGLHHFLNIIHEEYDFEMPLTCEFNRNPPVMTMHGNSLGGCQPKAMEAMCFQRLMTGSGENTELEAAMIGMVLSLFGDDGLHWVQGSPDKPWLNIPEPFAMVHGQGRMLRPPDRPCREAVIRRKVTCSVNNRERLTNRRLGNYLRVDGLKPRDVIRIRFPVEERTELWTVPKRRSKSKIGSPEREEERQVHTCRFRGNTLIEIDPTLNEYSPLYKRRAEIFNKNLAPMKNVRCYSSPLVMRW